MCRCNILKSVGNHFFLINVVNTKHKPYFCVKNAVRYICSEDYKYITDMIDNESVSKLLKVFFIRRQITQKIRVFHGLESLRDSPVGVLTLKITETPIQTILNSVHTENKSSFKSESDFNPTVHIRIFRCSHLSYLPHVLPSKTSKSMSELIIIQGRSGTESRLSP